MCVCVCISIYNLKMTGKALLENCTATSRLSVQFSQVSALVCFPYKTTVELFSEHLLPVVLIGAYAAENLKSQCLSPILYYVQP